MNILAIDPGTTESGWCVYNPETKTPVAYGVDKNEDVLELVYKRTDCELAIEMVACYGMPVGKTTFETCLWIGRFIQQFHDWSPNNITKVYRKDVKLHMCNSMRAKDTNICQAICDRFGGTRKIAVGTKKKPGPLYGMAKHMWAAFAIAITHAERINHANNETI